jgi:hypothetical protein
LRLVKIGYRLLIGGVGTFVRCFRRFAFLQSRWTGCSTPVGPSPRSGSSCINRFDMSAGVARKCCLKTKRKCCLKTKIRLDGNSNLACYLKTLVVTFTLSWEWRCPIRRIISTRAIVLLLRQRKAASAHNIGGD